MRTVSELAALGDALAGEPSKLAKAELLAVAFRRAAWEGTLKLVVRFLGGRVFGVSDPRTLGVRSATVRDAVVRAAGVDPAEWRRHTLAAGETGDALAAVHGRFPSVTRTGPLTLEALEAEFAAVAAVSSSAGKRDRLAGLLIRAAGEGPRPLVYVGKVISGDLRIGVAEGLLLEGVAAAFDVDLKAVRLGFRLLGDVAEVAEAASVGGEAALRSAPFALFRPVAFMLAAVAADAGELAERVTGPALLEDKLDGIRVQAHKSGEGDAVRVELYTRTLDRVTESFPDVVKRLEMIRGDVLLDGEIVALTPRGEIAPFAALQPRLNRRQLTRALLEACPAGFVPFDVLMSGGRLLLDEPLSVRRATLEGLLAGGAVRPLAALRVEPGVTAAEIAAHFEASRGRRNEGLMLKLLSSAYTPGRRGGVWFKLKGHLPTLDCVVVQAEVGHGKRRGVLSDYTFAVRETTDPDSPLLTLGKAYSGLTDAEIAELTGHFRETATATDGRRYTVPPTVVLEIAFDAIQRSDRHASGFALRFPRIARWRRDKLPGDIDTLAEVRRLFESPDNLNRAEPVSEPPPSSGQLSLFGD